MVSEQLKRCAKPALTLLSLKIDRIGNCSLMKNIQLFKRKEVYEEFVFNEIFKEKRIKDHPFYRNLIQFVLDAKAPVFYEQTDASEYANFSAYYSWVLRRAGYTNAT